MKINKFIASICLVFSLVFLTSCGGIHLDSMPKTDASVFGNGGTSVYKDDYIYFVNSYGSHNGLGKNDNNNGKVKKGAICRTKLKDGKVEYKDNKVQNYDIVVSKLVGYEFTSLYIFDDYIYYPTPNMEYSKEGTLNTKAVDFCRTKLDGSKTEVLYTAEKYDEKSSFEVYKIGSKIYLVVFEANKLVKVEIDKHVKSPITLVDNITSAKMTKIYDYKYSNDVKVTGTQGFVYYTRDFNEDEDNAYDTSNIKGNVLGQVNIVDGKRIERKDNNIKYGLTTVTTDYIYVTKGVDIYAIDKSFPLANNVQNVQDIRISHSNTETLSMTNFYTLKNTNGYIYCLNEKTYYKSDIKKGKTYEISSKALKILNDKDNFAYYTEGTSIKRINLVPTYINEKEFTLEADAKLNGKIQHTGDLIKANTIISESEFFTLTNPIDKFNFTLNFNPELIVEDSNLDSNYMDFTQEDVIYFFVKSSSTEGENNTSYMKRVVISPDNKVEPKEDEKDENKLNNLGYKAETLSLLSDLK